MAVTERMAGFDTRENWLDYDAIWDPLRRETFLYRHDLDKPFSIDPAVWPSLFTAAGVKEPDEKFGYQDCWADLGALQSATTQLFRSHPLLPFEIVAFTLVEDDTSRQSRASWLDIIPPVTPDRRDAAWQLAGYDVADTWATSALTNCGFVPGVDDVDALRRRWEGSLNRHHLFAAEDEAFAFRDMSNVRLQADHAPCFVFGVWRVR
jgi:hypothetical protein